MSVHAATIGNDAHLWTCGMFICTHCKWRWDSLKHYGTPSSAVECPRCGKTHCEFVDFKQLQARIDKALTEEHW